MPIISVFRMLVRVHVFALGVIFFASPIFVRAQTASPNPTVPLLRISRPSLSGSSFQPSTGYVFLNEFATTTLSVHTTVTYGGGCPYIMDRLRVNLAVYRAKADDCSDTCPNVSLLDGGCRLVTSSLRDGICDASTISIPLECRFSLPYYATPTDLPGQEDDRWAAVLQVTDGKASFVEQLPFEVASLRAIYVEGAANYATGSLGAVVASAPLTIHNSGNVPVPNLTISARPLRCTRGEIPAFHQRFSFDAQPDRDKAVALSPAGEAYVTLSLEKSSATRLARRTLYWWLAIPAKGVGGRCVGGTSYTIN